MEYCSKLNYWFAIARFRYIEVLFQVYSAITGVKEIIRYAEDFVISRFHCIGF